MVDHPLRVAAAATNGVYEDELLEEGVLRTILALAVDEELGDFEFDTGEIPLAVAWAKTGFVYFYDSTDSTTVDDELTTLVTGNGLRYAIEDAASISLNSVIDVVVEPTGSEVVGDAYIVGVGTGAFAGQDDNVAFLTRRGWVFASPEIGMTVLNEATGENTQFTDAGWGAFAVEFADGSIPPKALQFPGGLIVEDTLNTPPGSPTTGKFWIVGSVPTGAFVGHAADLAYWTSSAWAFMDPADGWSAYHKTSGFEVYYVSGSWLGSTGSDLQTFSTPGTTSWTKPAKGTMALIECWGAGGSGARPLLGDGSGGGGGGGYLSRVIPLASLASSVTVTVGAGGPAKTTNGNGTAGGNSSFGSHVVAYGGGGGSQNTTSGGGGGGGGQGGAGVTASSANGGNGGVTGASQAGGAGGGGGVGGNSSFGGGGGGSGGSAGSAGGTTEFGGGGGGGGGSSTSGGAGGNSMYGGGGGGGGGDTSGGAGGTSLWGGAGGAGSTGSTAATNGAQPGGGGGGSEDANSGKGGDGMVRVTVF